LAPKSLQGFTGVVYSSKALLHNRLPEANLQVTTVQWVIKILGIIEKEWYKSSGLQEQVKWEEKWRITQYNEEHRNITYPQITVKHTTEKKKHQHLLYCCVM
jgi:hypothetical protein